MSKRLTASRQYFGPSTSREDLLPLFPEGKVADCRGHAGHLNAWILRRPDDRCGIERAGAQGASQLVLTRHWAIAKDDSHGHVQLACASLPRTPDQRSDAEGLCDLPPAVQHRQKALLRSSLSRSGGRRCCRVNRWSHGRCWRSIAKSPQGMQNGPPNSGSFLCPAQIWP